MLKRALQHAYIAAGSKWRKADVARAIALVDANAVKSASTVLRMLRGMHSFSPKAEMELIQGLARQLRREGFGVALHTATYETVREQAIEIARKRFYALRRKAGVRAARFRRGAVQECLRKIKAYASSDDGCDTDDDGDSGAEADVEAGNDGGGVEGVVPRSGQEQASTSRANGGDGGGKSKAASRTKGGGVGKSKAASRAKGGGGGKSKASRPAKVIEKRPRRLKQYLVGFTIVPPNAMGSDALACFEPVRSLDAASMREEAGGVRTLRGARRSRRGTTLRGANVRHMLATGTPLAVMTLISAHFFATCVHLSTFFCNARSSQHNALRTSSSQHMLMMASCI